MWWTHGDGWLLSEKKTLCRCAVKIAAKRWNSFICGRHAINNTTPPIEGLSFKPWNREKEGKKRNGTLSLITVANWCLFLQAEGKGDRKSARHHGAAANPKCQPSVIYLLCPWSCVHERAVLEHVALAAPSDKSDRRLRLDAWDLNCILSWVISACWCLPIHFHNGMDIPRVKDD